MKHVGNEINRIVEERGIVKKDFARSLNKTEQWFYQIVKKSSIDSALLGQIADRLNISVSYFFDDEIGVNKTEVGHRVSGLRNKVEGNINLATCEGELDKAIVQIEYLQREIENKNQLIEEKDKVIAEKERLICVLMEKK